MFVVGATAAEGDKKTDTPATPEAISASATAKDIKKVDCKKLTVKALNGLTDAKACSAITAACLKEFDVTDLNKDCLSNIEKNEWKKLNDETVKQLTKTKVEDLSLTKEQFAAIFKKIKLDKDSVGFTGYVVRDPELLSVVLESSDPEVFKAYLTADNVAALNLVVFRRFGKATVEALADDAFSKINGNQIAMIPAKSFAGFSSKQIAAIPPAALTSLTSGQAANLSKDCWDALTPEQVKSFGPSVTSVIKLSAQGAQRDQEVLARRQFKDQHPCQAFPAIKDKLKDDMKKAIEEHCKPVEAFAINNASFLAISLAATGVMMAAALIPAFL